MSYLQLFYSDHIICSPSLSAFLQGESNELGGKSLKLRTDERGSLLLF